jgi:hypothetical protein
MLQTAWRLLTKIRAQSDRGLLPEHTQQRKMGIVLSCLVLPLRSKFKLLTVVEVQLFSLSYTGYAVVYYDHHVIITPWPGNHQILAELIQAGGETLIYDP